MIVVAPLLPTYASAGVRTRTGSGVAFSKSAGEAYEFQGQSGNAVQPQSSEVLTERERRAKAYAKMLEGQRYFASMARGDVETNLKSAQVAFREAIALEPKLIEAHSALAEVAFYLQDMDQAAAEGEQAKSLDPNNIGAHRILSRVYSVKSGLRGGNLDKKAADLAIGELREVVRLDKNNAEAWALLGEFYRETGRVDEAIDALKHWAAAPPTSDTRFYQVFTEGRDLTPDAASARLAETLIMAGRPVEAVAAARRAIALNPQNPEYGGLLGQALEASGSGGPEMIAELQKIAAQNPANTNLLTSLAHAQARAGKVNEAAETLQTAIAKKTGDERGVIMLRLDLAKIYTDALRYDDAIGVYEGLLKDRKISDAAPVSDEDRRFAGAILQRVLDIQQSAGRSSAALATVGRMRRLLGPNDSTAEAAYIAVLKEQGKKSEALEAARTAKQKFPENNEFVRLEADALTSLGRVDEAADLMKSRLKGNLNDFSLLLTISNFYSEAGRGKDAVSYARKALELVPATRTDLSSVGLISLASAQERAGDMAGAEQSLRQVLKSEPNNGTVLNNLGYFLVERNERLDEAVQLIQRAVQQEPTNPSFLDSLGWAYFKLGKLDEAERYLTDAAQRSRSSSAIQEHLGELYLRRQKSEQAIVAFQRARSLAVDKESADRIDARLKSLDKH
jgi:tetratricopeptide (TPR) repeat protein